MYLSGQLGWSGPRGATSGRFPLGMTNPATRRRNLQQHRRLLSPRYKVAAFSGRLTSHLSKSVTRDLLKLNKTTLEAERSDQLHHQHAEEAQHTPFALSDHPAKTNPLTTLQHLAAPRYVPELINRCGKHELTLDIDHNLRALGSHFDLSSAPSERASFITLDPVADCTNASLQQIDDQDLKSTLSTLDTVDPPSPSLSCTSSSTTQNYPEPIALKRSNTSPSDYPPGPESMHSSVFSIAQSVGSHDTSTSPTTVGETEIMTEHPVVDCDTNGSEPDGSSSSGEEERRTHDDSQEPMQDGEKGSPRLSPVATLRSYMRRSDTGDSSAIAQKFDTCFTGLENREANKDGTTRDSAPVPNGLAALTSSALSIHKEPTEAGPSFRETRSVLCPSPIDTNSLRTRPTSNRARSDSSWSRHLKSPSLFTPGTTMIDDDAADPATIDDSSDDDRFFSSSSDDDDDDDDDDEDDPTATHDLATEEFYSTSADKNTMYVLSLVAAWLRSCSPSQSQGTAGGSGTSTGSNLSPGDRGGFYHHNGGLPDRRRGLSNAESNEDEDDEDPGQRQSQGTPASAQGKRPKFPCPFKERYPNMPWEKGCDKSWPTISRVKEHIYRNHLLPMHCRRCFKTFTAEPELDSHEREDTRCQVLLRPPGMIGVTDQTLGALKSRKGSSKRSDHQNWAHVRRILFPHNSDGNQDELSVSQHRDNPRASTDVPRQPPMDLIWQISPFVGPQPAQQVVEIIQSSLNPSAPWQVEWRPQGRLPMPQFPVPPSTPHLGMPNPAPLTEHLANNAVSPYMTDGYLLSNPVPSYPPGVSQHPTPSYSPGVSQHPTPSYPPGVSQNPAPYYSPGVSQPDTLSVPGGPFNGAGSRLDPSGQVKYADYGSYFS